MDCSPPGSSVHGILQARILEWVAIPFSRGPSQPRDQIQVSCIAGRLFTIWATGKPAFLSTWYFLTSFLCVQNFPLHDFINLWGRRKKPVFPISLTSDDIGMWPGLCQLDVRGKKHWLPCRSHFGKCGCRHPTFRQQWQKVLKQCLVLSVSHQRPSINRGRRASTAALHCPGLLCFQVESASAGASLINGFSA